MDTKSLAWVLERLYRGPISQHGVVQNTMATHQSVQNAACPSKQFHGMSMKSAFSMAFVG